MTGLRLSNKLNVALTIDPEYCSAAGRSWQKVLKIRFNNQVRIPYIPEPCGLVLQKTKPAVENFIRRCEAYRPADQIGNCLHAVFR